MAGRPTPARQAQPPAVVVVMEGRCGCERACVTRTAPPVPSTRSQTPGSRPRHRTQPGPATPASHARAPDSRPRPPLGPTGVSRPGPAGSRGKTPCLLLHAAQIGEQESCGPWGPGARGAWQPRSGVRTWATRCLATAACFGAAGGLGDGGGRPGGGDGGGGAEGSGSTLAAAPVPPPDPEPEAFSLGGCSSSSPSLSSSSSAWMRAAFSAPLPEPPCCPIASTCASSALPAATDPPALRGWAATDLRLGR